MFVIECPDEETLAFMEYVAAAPCMEFPIRETVRLRVVRISHGLYDFASNAHTPSAAPGSAMRMLERMHAILGQQTHIDLPGCALIHGVSLRHEGRRIVLFGPKAAGKTTLSLFALQNGFAVEGDEHVIVHHDAPVVEARPRSLRVKTSSLAYVPDLAERIRICPKILNWEGDPIYAFQPALPQTPWRIERGRADVLVCLTPNHGGLSSLKPLTVPAMFERLLPEVALPQDKKAVALAKLHLLATDAVRVELRVGNLNGAMELLKSIAKAC